MKQAVFHDRLQNELHDGVICNRRIDFRDELHRAAAAQVRQLHKQSHVLRLVTERQEIAAVAETEAVKTRKLHNDVHRLHIAVCGRFPRD